MPGARPPSTRYFYPRSPRGERLEHIGRIDQTPGHFYPRSPRGERPFQGGTADAWGIFLSTLPARGATEAVGPLFEVDSISIHAPREGSDPQADGADHRPAISIHAPREGSDRPPRSGRSASAISIHAPREGSDSAETEPATFYNYFYPRSP